MSINERREAVIELKKDGLSQRKIGEVLGVAQMTVNRDLNNESNDSGSKQSDKGKTLAAESNDSKPSHPFKRPQTPEEIEAALERSKAQDRRAKSSRGKGIPTARP